MTAASHDLKHLVAVLRDGEKFYADAAARTKLDAQRALFGDMALVKREIADELQALLPESDRADAAEGTWIGKVRECYAGARAALGSDAETVFVRQLEAAEDRVMEAFRNSLATTRQRRVRKTLERHYPRASAAHARMSAMKHAQRSQ